MEVKFPMNKSIWIAILTIGLMLFAACSSAPLAPADSPDAVAPEGPIADSNENGASAPSPVMSGDRKDETTSRREVAAETNTVVVEIRGFSYDPDELVVPAGTVVTFLNEDHTEHSVTSDSFDSGIIPRNGGEWQYTFSTPGTYAIHSLDFRTVNGVIIVE